jgi:hypothetical protein
MNKNIVLGALAIVVLAILVYALTVSKPKESSGQISNTAQNNPIKKNQPAADSSKTDTAMDNIINTDGKTVADFMEGKLGDHVYCEFTKETIDKTNVNGTAYVSGKNVRVDYKVQAAGQTDRDMHMISDGTYGYVWGDVVATGAKQGTKFKINNDAIAAETEKAKNSESLDYKAPVAKCEVRSADAKLFVIPSDVTFTDMEDLQNPVIPNPAVGEKNCSICNSLPAEQKATCRTALNCK